MSTIPSYLGVEVVLFLAPFLKNPKNLIKNSTIAISIITVIYTYIILLSLLAFGADEVIHLVYPTMTLAKMIEVPGAFLERLDSFLMVAWIPFSYTTIIIYFYVGVFAISQIFKLKDHRPIAINLLPIVLIIAISSMNIAEINEWLSMVGKIAPY